MATAIGSVMGDEIRGAWPDVGAAWIRGLWGDSWVPGCTYEGTDLNNLSGG